MNDTVRQAQSVNLYNDSLTHICMLKKKKKEENVEFNTNFEINESPASAPLWV